MKKYSLKPSPREQNGHSAMEEALYEPTILRQFAPSSPGKSVDSCVNPDTQDKATGPESNASAACPIRLGLPEESNRESPREQNRSSEKLAD
ncbi:MULTISPECIES: hypothetical protein [Pseudomonas]|uniref:hypothetical protein n=1 Tax=Pseudomonas TaxID=286 RepID=UPI0015FF4D98|nr:MULTISPECIES: hypothetical protein [Pseudomonas]MCX2815800.1 hypothetical protein [Pseudomonas sp. DCB_E]MCX9145110.1 hypothetical protein [Pseudomonas sp. DCB_Q]MDD2004330.1 hypothetical protein [Pseudomonas putida]MDH0705825.1 hypothetical protein [Pseudomonas sp. GD03862]HEN8704974.1 hypothetical protein [Pseudomonas putida]